MTLEELEKYFDRLLDMDEKFNSKKIKNIIGQTKKALDKLSKEYEDRKK